MYNYAHAPCACKLEVRRYDSRSVILDLPALPKKNVCEVTVYLGLGGVPREHAPVCIRD